MVLILCKRLPREEHSKDYDEFLMSFPNTTNIGMATNSIQLMQNSRVRLKWMVAAARQLAKDSVPEASRQMLEIPASAGNECLSLQRTELKHETKQEEIGKLFDDIKGAVMILFPGECSGADCQQRLSAVLDSEDASDIERSKAHRILSIIDDGATTEDILLGTCVIWWASKPLDRNSDLAKYTGKNEKTKLTVKLTKEGSRAPTREPAIDNRTQAEMMAYWYKKQEEQKKLVEDDDISYANSEWANPKGLKNQLHGTGEVKYFPSLT